MKENEFYIGWQAEMPPGFARRVRQFLLATAIALPILAALLVVFQSGFSTGTFDYGKTTTLTGILQKTPVPFLTIENGTDASGKPLVQNLLLLAAGKFGAEKTIEKMERAAGLDLEGKRLKISGFLIYNDGKAGFEIADSGFQMLDSPPENHLEEIGAKPKARPEGIGAKLKLRGEISDPKCLLGVMKPGEGKPHLDCAVRCLAGGIPAVLKVSNEAGETEYYLLRGQDGEPINEQLLDFVAEGVELRGRLDFLGDWPVVYVEPGSLKRLNKWLLNPGPMCK